MQDVEEKQPLTPKLIHLPRPPPLVFHTAFVYAASVHENAPPSEAALQVETPRVEVQSAESSAPLADGNMDYGTITHSGGKGAAPASVIAELPELGTQQQAKHAPRMKLYI